MFLGQNIMQNIRPLEPESLVHVTWQKHRRCAPDRLIAARVEVAPVVLLRIDRWRCVFERLSLLSRM